MIKVRVKNRIITCKKELVEDNVDTFSLVFDFDSMWEGYTKRITFFNDGIEEHSSNPIEIPLEDSCIIPWEVIQSPGNLYLSIKGTKQDTNEVILTQLMNNPIKVNIAGLSGGVVPAEPTPDMVTLIMSTAQEAKDIAQSVKDDADAGKFIGPPGPKGDKGINGVDGKDGVGVSKAEISADGILTITLTGGKVINVGNVKGEKGDPSVIAIDNSEFDMWNMGDAIYCTKKEVTIKSDSDNESTIIVPQGTLIASYKPEPYLGNAYHYLIIIGECTFKDKKYKYGIHRYYNITDEIVSSTSFDDFALKTEIPTKTSQLTNDNDFVSDAEIRRLLENKQDKLTVGEGLKLENNTLTLDIPVATAGTGYGG